MRRYKVYGNQKSGKLLVVGIYHYLQAFSTIPRWLDLPPPARMLENRGKFKLVLVGNPEHEQIDPLVVNFSPDLLENLKNWKAWTVSLPSYLQIFQH